jgi:hypothetical protein
MGYTLGGLTSGYTKEDAKSLIYKTITEGATASLMKLQTGIKTTETINIVATRGVWQGKTDCNPVASGATAFTQRDLAVGGVSVILEWCEEQLEPYYLQGAMKAGSIYTDLTFRTQILDDVRQNVLKDKEVAIWQGDTTSVNVYLNKFDGLIKLIAAEGTVNTATPIAWSVANSRTAVQNALTAVTNDMYTNGNLKMFMGLAEARDYRLKLGIDNLYHMTGADAKLYAENSDVEIVPVAGLSGTKKIYVMSPDNMYLGTDMSNEEEKFDLKVLENEKLRLTVKFKYGVQVAFPDLIVKQVNT